MDKIKAWIGKVFLFVAMYAMASFLVYILVFEIPAAIERSDGDLLPKIVTSAFVFGVLYGIHAAAHVIQDN